MRALTHPNETTLCMPWVLASGHFACTCPSHCPYTASPSSFHPACPALPAFLLPAALHALLLASQTIYCNEIASLGFGEGSREQRRQPFMLAWLQVAMGGDSSSMYVCLRLQIIHRLLLHSGYDGVTSCPLVNVLQASGPPLSCFPPLSVHSMRLQRITR